MSAEDLVPRLEAVEEDVAALKRAFPSGDVEGHRRYHELMIEQIEERRRLRRAISEKTISGLIWAGMVGMGVAVLHYLKDFFR